MNQEIKALKRELISRRNELVRLIQQMKTDQLSNSPVYRSLEKELETIHQKLHKEDK